MVIYPSLDGAYTIYDYYKILKRTNNKILKAPTIKRTIFANFVPIAGNILEWDKIEGASHYELIAYKTNRDSANNFPTFQFVRNYIVTDTNLTLDTLEYNMVYQFKIRAYNDSLSSEWNQGIENLYTLNSKDELSVPVIIYPEPYSDLYYPSKMTMRWSSNENVDSYEMILYETDIINKIILIHETELKDTSYYVDILTPLTDYILSVRSKRNDTLSEWANSYFITEQSTDIIESESKKLDMMIKIIPNPVTSTCKILFNYEPIDLISLKLFNSMGIELEDLTRAAQLNIGDDLLELNLSSLNSGIYFIVAKNNRNIYSTSFVVIK
ncbi:MAG: fibronectin type III domain-containing protein [Bacteroidetes bacterium]|nr:MAG: fibronectin type III domain-containing protein [Bacteroidota bacterium]